MYADIDQISPGSHLDDNGNPSPHDQYCNCDDCKRAWGEVTTETEN